MNSDAHQTQMHIQFFLLKLLYFIRLLLIIIISPIVTLQYWMLSTVAVPLYIFRKLLAFIATYLDPDLCKMVNSMGSIISRDFNDWSQLTSHSVTVIFTITGCPTIHELRQLVLHKVVHSVDGNHNQLEYPELQQYFTKRLSYLFFKWDRSFDICNHVKIFCDKELLPNPETESVNDAKLLKIWEKISTSPMAAKRSPWDVYIIPNYVPNHTGSRKDDVNDPDEQKTSIILRVHHGLSDGIAIYKLLLTLTDNGLTNLEDDVPVFRKAPTCFNLLIHLRAFFCGPASMVKKTSVGFDIYNPLHPTLRKKRGQAHILTTSIDLQTVKKIARAHLEVSFHSVLMAAIAGGIRNYLIGNGHSIPVSPIRIGFPIPKPGHTHKLRNEYLPTFMDLPIHKKTAKQRLFAIEQRSKQLANESFLSFMAQTWKIMGLFPTTVGKFLTSKAAVTLIYSDIKGPNKLMTILNGKSKLLDLKFCFGLGTDDLGMAVTSISYNGKIHLVISLDHSVAKTRDKVQQLMNLILKELDELQYGDSTNL